ncbi:MAG: SET domain-containing protein-lysine N-methyltransferase [Rhodothermales bacterium]|nr:SET domain-containing protein-lysine N-methyltransferase [Rhodothermales bacterium]
MKICVLEEAGGSADAALGEQDWPTVILPYLDGHDAEVHAIHKATAVRQVIALAQRGFDVFINLCDGAWESESPGIEVVQALERVGVPFTGATSAFYDPSREEMKRVCHAYGIPTPAYVQATDPADVERAAERLRFPLFVKHPHGYSSVGLSRASRVETPEALRAQAAALFAAHGGALIEEFVEGREFTVLVAENPDDPAAPVVYEPVEFRFPEGETFKHYDLKWKEYEGLSVALCDDPALARRLKNLSRAMFVGLGGAGYGRCDLRVDAAGVPHMLEINPNCGLFYAPEDAGSADFILLNDPDGHRGFVDLILRAALARHRRQIRPWTGRVDHARGYGLYARRAIAPGECIERFEETPHVLVSRSHVRHHWSTERQAWFARHAYPLTDEIYVAPSHRPDDAHAVNHACDPNAWLDGLDLVARRAIAPGEEITIDYATRHTEMMPAFGCSCGAPECRGVIRGTDHLQPFVERYGTHVSDHVRARRRIHSARGE